MLCTHLPSPSNRSFSHVDFMATYRVCYFMCTQRPPYNFSEQLYERHGQVRGAGGGVASERDGVKRVTCGGFTLAAFTPPIRALPLPQVLKAYLKDSVLESLRPKHDAQLLQVRTPERGRTRCCYVARLHSTCALTDSPMPASRSPLPLCRAWRMHGSATG